MNANEYIETGKRCVASGRKQEGLANFMKAVELEPRNFMALYSVAACYAMMDRFPEALQYYDKALEIKPDDLETRMERENCNAHVVLGKEGVQFAHAVMDDAEKKGWPKLWKFWK